MVVLWFVGFVVFVSVASYGFVEDVVDALLEVVGGVGRGAL